MKDKYKKLTDSYTQEELQRLEDYIYSDIPKKKRLDMEFKRLRAHISDIFSEDTSNKDIAEDLSLVDDYLQLINFDSTLEDEVAVNIIGLQMKTGQEVRLYSKLNKYAQEDEYRDYLEGDSEIRRTKDESRTYKKI